MKKVLLTLLAAVLLAAAAPAVRAQEQTRASLTSEEAHKLLGRLSGNWLVSHYAWQPDRNAYYQSSGKATVSPAHQGSYLHEQTYVRQPDGSQKRQECFLGYSAAKERFELIQADKQNGNTVLLVGQWHPDFHSITLTHPDGLKRGGPNNVEYVYVFLPEGMLLKVVRILDEEGNYRIQSQDYYAPQHTASF